MFGTNDRHVPCCSLFSALFVGAVPAPSFASSAPENSVHFAWVRGAGAESCPNEATLVKIVAARLGRDPFSRESSQFIEGVVERTPAGWSAHIRMSKDGRMLGTRELTSESPDCSAITAASVLAIAIGIDPDAALSMTPAPPAVDPPVPVTPEPPKPKEEVHCPASVPAKPLVRPAQPLPLEIFPKIAASFRGVLGIGLLPQIAPGFALNTGLEGRRWEGSLGLLWLPEVATTNGDFAFGITAVSLGACGHPVRARRLLLSGCLRLYGGGIHQVVASLLYAPLDVSQRLWFTAAPSVRARFAIISKLSLDAGVEFVVPLIRHEFAVVGRTEPVFAMGPLGLTTFFGPTMSIP